MENAYWFIPSKVDEAIDALQDLGYVIDIKRFHEFTGKYIASNLIVYRRKEGLAHSTSTLEDCKNAHKHSTYIDLLEPKELVLTDEYKESQNSFAELCNPTWFTDDTPYDEECPF